MTENGFRPSFPEHSSHVLEICVPVFPYLCPSFPKLLFQFSGVKSRKEIGEEKEMGTTDDGSKVTDGRSWSGEIIVRV